MLATLNRTFLLLAAVALMGLSGCYNSDTDHKKPSRVERPYYMMFYKFDQYRTEQNEKNKMEYLPGKFVYLGDLPMLTSRNITRLESFPAEGGMGLRGYLDVTGTNLWTQMSGEQRGELMALVVDGKFRSFVKIPKFSSQSVFELAGPFDVEEAANMVAAAEENYSNARFLNK